MDTETFRHVSNVILWVGLTAAACGTAGVNYFRARLESEREGAAKAKEEQALRRASALQLKVDELLKGNETVVRQNEKLLVDIQGYQRDLRARDERIRELETGAKAAKRGVVERYDFNGAKRTQSGGHSTVVVGAEVNVFQELVALEKSKNYAALIRLAETQVARTPEWLTPYLFLGVAYANTGHRDKAIKSLQHVVDAAGGDPQYKEAGDLLARVRQAP